MYYPDSKVHGANMGPTWVLSAPDGTHVGPINLAIRVGARTGLASHAMAMTDNYPVRKAARRFENTKPLDMEHFNGCDKSVL